MNAEEYINSVVGKPWKNRANGPDNFDCFGLVLDSFDRVDGIILPQVPGYSDVNCKTEVAATAELNTGNWVQCGKAEGAMMVSYDASGSPVHVGRVLAGGVLHALGKNGGGSVKWHNHRIIKTIFRTVKYYAFNRPSP